MTKFARFNIIWQRGAFLTVAVIDAEHCRSITDTFVIREGEHPGFFFFFFFFFFFLISQIIAFFVFHYLPQVY